MMCSGELVGRLYRDSNRRLQLFRLSAFLGMLAVPATIGFVPFRLSSEDLEAEKETHR